MVPGYSCIVSGSIFSPHSYYVRRGICRLMATIAAVQPALAANSQLKRLLMLGECTDPTLLPLLGCLVMCVMYAVFRYSEVLYCLGVPRYGPI